MADKKSNGVVTLTLSHIVSRSDGVKSYYDDRFNVNRVIAEYNGDDKEIYRKTFEAKDASPVVPQQGTHTELNNLRRQWE